MWYFLNRKNSTKVITGIFRPAVFISSIIWSAAPVCAQTDAKVRGYVGILHPLVTYSKNAAPHYNFDGAYTVGLPAGINLWKSEKIGFSMEFVPLVRVANGTSRMNNFLFHPGALFALGNGFTLATRAAFETSGRYGFTPVLNKVVRKNKGSSYFVAVPVPARFGNDQPASLSVAFQFGVAF